MENSKEVINILPINDLRPHIESPHCLCKPLVENDGALIIYNAYDERDRREQFDEEMNKYEL